MDICVDIKNTAYFLELELPVQLHNHVWDGLLSEDPDELSSSLYNALCKYKTRRRR